MSADFLTQMAQSSRERTAACACALSRGGLARAGGCERRRAAAATLGCRLRSDRGAEAALARARCTERGGRRGSRDPTRVQAYAQGGAATVSVLTEPTRFDGALSHLEQAAAALAGRIPVMRKDFLVDRYQVYEARAAGAGGVLLIVRMLDDKALAILLESCIEMRLFALLEAFDEADLSRACALVERYRRDATLLVGVNSRDLETLRVSTERLATLAPRLPTGVPRVAESGIESGADAAQCVRAGYDLALVGGAS